MPVLRGRGRHARPRDPRRLTPLLLVVPLLGATAMAHRTPAGVTQAAVGAAPPPAQATPTAVGAGSPTAAARHEALLGRAVASPRVSPPAVTQSPTAVRPIRASRSVARTWVPPVEGRVTSSYGPRWGRRHGGVDVAAPTGVQVLAAAAGKVTFAGWAGGYGKLVRIRHTDGSVSSYAHLNRILVASGAVTAGQVIGEVGSTGRSTGPHLHFEIRIDDQPVDPEAYLRAREAPL